MGIQINPEHDAIASKPKVFIPQNKADVLPFLDMENQTFSDWEVECAKTTRRPSMTLGRLNRGDRAMCEAKKEEEGGNGTEGEVAGWRIDHKGKKVWSEDWGGVYRVGWEREVLDVEARVHETMWEANQCHTFTKYAHKEEPKAVLDVSGSFDRKLVVLTTDWHRARAVAHITGDTMAGNHICRFGSRTLSNGAERFGQSGT